MTLTKEEAYRIAEYLDLTYNHNKSITYGLKGGQELGNAYYKLCEMSGYKNESEETED